jgi:hypothetical protein
LKGRFLLRNRVGGSAVDLNTEEGKQPPNRAPAQRDETQRERAKGQEDEILEMLREAGTGGCLNSELWTVCHAVNSRISDLRKRGHRIEAMPEGRGVWRYALLESAPPVPDPQAAEKSPTKPENTLPLFAGARE